MTGSFPQLNVRVTVWNLSRYFFKNRRQGSVRGARPPKENARAESSLADRYRVPGNHCQLNLISPHKSMWNVPVCMCVFLLCTRACKGESEEERNVNLCLVHLYDFLQDNRLHSLKGTVHLKIKNTHFSSVFHHFSSFSIDSFGVSCLI